MTCASLVIPGRRANAGPEIQMQARSVFLDSGFALSARPGMTTYSIVKQHGRAASPVFFSAPGTPSSLSVPPAKAREMARQVAQPLFVLCRAPSRETRAPHGAPSRASSLQRRAALYGGRPFLPPAFAFCREAHGGRSAPGGHAPGGRLVVAAGRSSRRRPGAGEAFSPGRGRRIRSHPHDAS